MGSLRGIYALLVAIFLVHGNELVIYCGGYLFNSCNILFCVSVFIFQCCIDFFRLQYVLLLSFNPSDMTVMDSFACSDGPISTYMLCTVAPLLIPKMLFSVKFNPSAC